ncbi:MAG: AAA family ATPase, partial [Granulosicoccus sp.]|nr:AAA family ATPase [Granulosicoccus sp.]
AKLVLVGDAEQLQPIQAGCPFRDIAQQNGYVEIGTVRRQREAWQRKATQNLARGDGAQAVRAYRERGHVHEHPSAEAAMGSLVTDYLRDDSASRIILAHRNADVATLNVAIREALVARGVVAAGQPFRSRAPSVMAGLTTPFDLRAGDAIKFGVADKSIGIEAQDLGTYIGFADGRHHVRMLDGTEWRLRPEDYGQLQHREEAESSAVVVGAGDRVLFTRNDRTLGVNNGTLGTVLSMDGDSMLVAVDERKEPVYVRYDEYSSIQLGYAATIHKSQGMTVDRAFVLGSTRMDKHLGYVAMSRHRDRLDVYIEGSAAGFGQRVSQTNRQHTVLDVAERHGIELDPDHTDPFVFTDIAENQRSNRPATAGTDTSAVQFTLPISPTLEDATAAIKAQQLLDEATRAALLQMDRQHERALLPLTQRAEQARQALLRHNQTKPRSGLLTSKTLVAQWRSLKRQLEIAQGNARQAETRAIERYRGELGQRQYEAQALAEKKLHEAAALVKAHAARVLAGDLMGRWQALERDLAKLSRGELTGPGTTESSLRQSLARIFRQIEQSDDLRGALDKEQLVAFTEAARSNARSIEKQKSLERGQGHGR